MVGYAAVHGGGPHPIRNLVLKLGFRQTGEQWDEVDGLELVDERG